MAIKPIAADSTATVVWHEDPAINQEESDLVSHNENPTRWRENLKVRDGEQPTEFVIGVIPPVELSSYEDRCSVSEKVAPLLRPVQWHSLALLCFRRGLRDIINGPTELGTDENGRQRGIVPKVKNGQHPPSVDAQWLDKVFAKNLRACALHVGSAIYQWNQATEDDAKNS